MDKVELIKKRYDRAYSNQRNKLIMFNAIDEVLNQKTKDFTHNSKMGSPYAWAAVEMVTPRIVAKNPAVAYEAREQSDVPKAQNATDLYKYWAQKADSFNLFTDWTKVSCSYGTAVLKVIWKTEKQKVTKFVRENGEPIIDPQSEEFVTYEEEVTTYDDPFAEVMNNNYLFFSPGATDPNNATWIIHKYWRVLDDLKAENKVNRIYKNLGQLEGIKGKDESNEDRERHAEAGHSVEEADDTVDLIEILEMWDRTTGRQTMLANGKTLILDRPFPYWHGKMPFIKLNDSRIPYEWYGKGEVEPIMKDIYVIDCLTNSKIDDITGGRKKWKIRNNSNVDESELYEPDLPLHVDDMQNDAQLETYPDTTSGNSEEISRREASIQNTLGTADFTQNANSTADRTATGMTIKADQLNSRFDHKIKLFESALKELGDMILALYQQFLTSERSIRILGENGAEFKTIAPGDIAGDFDCIPEAGSSQSVDKNSEKQEISNAYALMKDNQYIKQDVLNAKVAEKFFPKDYSNMIQDPQDVKKQQLTELLQTPQVQQMIEQMAMEKTQGMMPQEDPRMTEEKDLKNKLLDHELELEKIKTKEQARMGMM